MARRGRPPYPRVMMLHTQYVRWLYNLHDPGAEDLLYETGSVRNFVRLHLSGFLPEEATILTFRHLLEEHGLGEVSLRTQA